MTLLHVEDLHVEFNTEDGRVSAVNGVSFSVHSSETLGIVGESGSGKSVTTLALLGLLPSPPARVTAGSAWFGGQDLLRMRSRELARIRGNRIAMIFQDPMTALNPFLTIEEQMTEVTRLHLKLSRRQAVDHAVAMLEKVGIPAAAHRLSDYPHQFSGGMRQRVMIAIALSCKPDVLIADEPTTALDVTIQAQILDLMRDLQREEGTAIILITHDLGVVAHLCQRVLVMYAGRIVEEAAASDLFRRPCHPYTIGLLGAVPRWDADQGRALRVIPGQPPDMHSLPPGCAFAPRCPCRTASCDIGPPPWRTRPGGGRHTCLIDVEAPSAPDLGSITE